MTTSEIRNRLADYAAGGLESAERAAIEAALARDPALRAELQRWEALRGAVRRTLASVVPPAGMAERIRAALSGRASDRFRRRRWVVRLSFSGMAAAAVVLLAFLVWPQTAGATSVEATGFANIFRRCALTHCHNALAVTPDGETALAQVRRCASFHCPLPDLARGGEYVLTGACQCPPDKRVKVVHAIYRSRAPGGEVISVFAVDRPIALCTHGKQCAHCPCGGPRRYREAVDGDVTILSWDEAGRTFVVAAQMPRAKLTHLLDGVTLTAGGCGGSADRAARQERAGGGG